MRRTSTNITNLTNLTFKRFNSSLVKPLNKECSHLTNNPGLNTLVNSTKLTDFFKEKNLNPVYIYENLELDSTQKKIKSVPRTLNLSGIYLILNKITLDYIGSASTNRFFARFSNHLVNFHGSKIVKAAVRNYNISQFAFIILELFPYIVVTKENNKILLDLEDFYIKSLLPNYNILTEAGSSFGYKHTPDGMTRINMMSNYSIERRLKIGNLNKNKIFSKETIEKMS